MWRSLALVLAIASPAVADHHRDKEAEAAASSWLVALASGQLDHALAQTARSFIVGVSCATVHDAAQSDRAELRAYLSCLAPSFRGATIRTARVVSFGEYVDVWSSGRCDRGGRGMDVMHDLNAVSDSSLLVELGIRTGTDTRFVIAVGPAGVTGILPTCAMRARH
jgi:hypothetical protein